MTNLDNRKTYKLGEVVNILDSRRVPLSSRQRELRHGKYPYYGAQGIIDYIDDYLSMAPICLLLRMGRT